MTLIVNADDLGYDAPTTDAIMAAHARGLISSATAMVFRADSARAAAAARDAGLPTGLHLNLTEPFDAPAVPGAVRAAQERLVRAFASGLWWRRWTYDPRIRADVDLAVRAQIEEHHRVHTAAPTHLDGHNHVHATLNVLLAGAVGVGLPYRRVMIDNHAGVALGRARQRVADRRFASTDRFLTMTGIFDAATAGASRAALGARTVEVMVHPAFAPERARLESAAWAALREPYATAGYEAVARG